MEGNERLSAARRAATGRPPQEEITQLTEQIDALLRQQMQTTDRDPTGGGAGLLRADSVTAQAEPQAAAAEAAETPGAVQGEEPVCEPERPAAEETEALGDEPPRQEEAEAEKAEPEVAPVAEDQQTVQPQATEPEPPEAPKPHLWTGVAAGPTAQGEAALAPAPRQSVPPEHAELDADRKHAEEQARLKKVAAQVTRERQRVKMARERLLLEWIIAIFAALVAAFILTQFVIVNAQVPTESMEDTIHIGDRVIGLRLAYGSENPQRGDIIIFQYPDDERQLYVKRIVGLPGEEVKIIDGMIYIDGVETPEVNAHIKDAPVGTYGPFEVPQDGYFVMGDNRNYSWDSRFWKNTYVMRDKIMGKARWRIYPDFATLE